MTRPTLPRHLHWLTRHSAIERGGVALTIGLGCWALAPAHFRWGTRLIAGWDGFALAALLLTWTLFLTADAAHIRRSATTQDPGRAALFAFALLGAGASLLAVGLLLGGTAQLARPELVVHATLSVLAVLLSWTLVHTLFTLHYAHEYFAENLTTPSPDTRQGLDFPGAPPVSYLDFAYFAFIVGMTAQTADVAVTSTRMRYLVLVHGALAFGFNTAVLALTVNVAAGL